MHVTKDSSTHYPDFLECLCVVCVRGACAWCLFVRGACVWREGLRGVCVRCVCLCVCVEGGGVCVMCVRAVFVCLCVSVGGGLRGVCVVCRWGGGVVCVCVYMLGVCVKLRPRTPELTGLQIYKKRHFQFNKNKQNTCHIE